MVRRNFVLHRMALLGVALFAAGAGSALGRELNPLHPSYYAGQPVRSTSAGAGSTTVAFDASNPLHPAYGVKDSHKWTAAVESSGSRSVDRNNPLYPFYTR
jgi:hypothetical protein